MVIAERTLILRQPEKEFPVLIKIFQPVLQGSADWSCDFEIHWPGHLRKAAIYGYDSAQAVILTMMAIGSEIYTSEEHKSGNLRWGNSEGGYGFPIPHIIRDLLVGEDKKFF